MASAGAIWGPATLRLLRVAATRASKAVRTQLAGATRPLHGEAQQIRGGCTGRQPIHPTALLKQQKRGARWFSSTRAQGFNNAVRRFLSSDASSASPGRFDRFKLPASNTSRRVAQFSGRAPFANALRPNLTGGALPRSAGGYGIGGGARYFSHTPAAPAQVVQNVSQAMRAFFLSGQKLRYDGLDQNNRKQYRAVSSIEDAALNKMKAFPHTAPGAFLDFQLSSTVRALESASAAACVSSSATGSLETMKDMATLNSDGLMKDLSADFGRALQHLTGCYADLRRLAVLGDLPIEMKKDSLRVRFPGVDGEAVRRLCDDIGVRRGIVGEDVDFETQLGSSVALKFPFAPVSSPTITSMGGSAPPLNSDSLDDAELSSNEDDSFLHEAFADQLVENPWLCGSEDYESMSPPLSSIEHCSDYSEGSDGIHQFLEECDRARGRLG